MAFRFKLAIPGRNERGEGPEVVRENIDWPTLSPSRSVCSRGKRDILRFACFGRRDLGKVHYYTYNVDVDIREQARNRTIEIR